MTMRAILTTSLIAFAVTLAVIVGQRLSGEAMAVIVGVIAGVAASIPTSLIVVWVATRRRPEEIIEREPRGYAPSVQPPPEPRIVVVTPPPASAWPLHAYPTYAPPYPAVPAAPRTFSVIGGEED